MLPFAGERGNRSFAIVTRWNRAAPFHADLVIIASECLRKRRSIAAISPSHIGTTRCGNVGAIEPHFGTSVGGTKVPTRVPEARARVATDVARAGRSRAGADDDSCVVGCCACWCRAVGGSSSRESSRTRRCSSTKTRGRRAGSPARSSARRVSGPRRRPRPRGRTQAERRTRSSSSSRSTRPRRVRSSPRSAPRRAR